MRQPAATIKLSRRTFIRVSTQLSVGALLVSPLKCLASIPACHPLSFYHTHTGESLQINFDLKRCCVENVKNLDHFMRDFRTGDIHPIDTRLINMLCHLQMTSSSSGTFELISGYRSPATNMKLRQTSNGVAKKSLHMQGRAIDIRLTDVPTDKLRSIACSLKQGGVGFYPKSDFIHLDTGRTRAW
jgi:uncharacterized protein YcbK (DUF882 family)